MARRNTTGEKCGLEREREAQQEWLDGRAQEITGTGVARAVQRELFDEPAGGDGKGPPQAPWQTIEDPAERLAAFASDSHQPPSKRSEADGVLRIRRQRTGIFDSLTALGEPEIIPLGVLMLLPSVVTG